MSTKLKTGVRRARGFNSQWCVLQYVYLESPLCTNTCSICFHMDRMEALTFCSTCLSLAFSPQHVSEKETNLTWVVAVMLATITGPQKVSLNKWTWWQTAKDSWGFVIYDLYSSKPFINWALSPQRFKVSEYILVLTRVSGTVSF